MRFIFERETEMPDYAKVIAWKIAEREKLAKILAIPTKKRKKRRPRRGCSEKQFPIHNKDDYQRYLKTRHWRITRARALRKAGRQCAVCGTVACRPEVHHKHYETLWKEKLHDLEVLCPEHHAEHHLGIGDIELQHLKACAQGF